MHIADDGNTGRLLRRILIGHNINHRSLTSTPRETETTTHKIVDNDFTTQTHSESLWRIAVTALHSPLILCPLLFQSMPRQLQRTRRGMWRRQKHNRKYAAEF